MLGYLVAIINLCLGVYIIMNAPKIEQWLFKTADGSKVLILRGVGIVTILVGLSKIVSLLFPWVFV